METRRSWCIALMLLLSLDAASPGDSPPGLLCVNDDVNAVTCSWHGLARTPGTNCSITGALSIWILKDGSKKRDWMKRSCRLEPRGDAPPGCTFAFEEKEFTSYSKRPFIGMECDGTAVENLTGYEPRRHVKMNPPGVPAVNATDRDTWIWWGPGGQPWSRFTLREFHAQIRRDGRPWTDAIDLFTRDPEVRVLSREVRGRCEVRVRVRPREPPNDHWSNWSPATSWLGAEDGSDPEDVWALDLLVARLGASAGVICVVFLVLYAGCLRRRVYKEKPVPNPSKYFCTLQSLYGGNLKAWLNPAEAFFTSQPIDGISAVEVCHVKTANGSPMHPGPSASTDASGSSSSSSSSFYSNIGYFLSSSSGGSAPAAHGPPYFTYQDEGDIGKAGIIGSLCCSSSGHARSYESLAREPQSPDSGFGFGKEDKAEKEDAEDPGEHICPLLVLPFQRPAPPLSPPRPCPGEPPVDPADGSSVCRSTSMNVQPCRAGYLTLKEVHMTFSNKSI